MKVIAPRYSNCLLILFYLLLRGKIHFIVGVNSDSSWWPWHFLTLNKKGHALHFSHILKHEWNHLAPWWFLGRIQGIAKCKQKEIIAQHHKEIRFVTNRIYLSLTICFIFCAFAIIPYLIVFALYPYCFVIYWPIHAIVRKLQQSLK